MNIFAIFELTLRTSEDISTNSDVIFNYYFIIFICLNIFLLSAVLPPHPRVTDSLTAVMNAGSQSRRSLGRRRVEVRMLLPRLQKLVATGNMRHGD